MKFTEDQLRAIERRDHSLLVSAGAGTGKTSVLVERFVCAVTEDREDVESILAITFTDKAAAQLKQRVRARFVALGATDHARAAEAAWISTIHGFCARLLRTHALVAGIDPEFRVLDAVESERLALDAFDSALATFLERAEGPARLRLIAAYSPGKLADMVRSAYGHLRSLGREPRLPEIEEPRDAGLRLALIEAAGPALAELGAVDGKRVNEAREVLLSCEAALAGVEDPPPDLLGRLRLGMGAKALKGAACDAYRAAHEALSAFCLARAEYLDHVLLRELIDLYGDRYAQRKSDRSGLDFEDLELGARDLLRDHEAVRERYASRFSHVLVDEFQDTNPLQNEILDLLERDTHTGEERSRGAGPASTGPPYSFRVGDERQSIYRFRHADVKVFRDHHERARAEGRAEAIGVNFRSRGEVLDAIDLIFSRLWGDGFDPLIEAPGARAENPRHDPCVELLLTDKSRPRWVERFPDQETPFGATMPASIPPWRAAEARLLARRIDELTRGGEYALSDVVILLRATTHISIYERALEERGIPTYVLGGRGYWSQQQVSDLRAYLAALANPLDELSLISLLASPIVGMTLDSLVVIAQRGGDLWRAISDPGGVPGLCEEQAGRLAGFAERFAAERELAPRVSLETLIDRAVTDSGYDRQVLALPAGNRRMANVRKLMRMAREYEAGEGRDLRGFIDFVAERDLVAEREGQAPLEAEDLDAVRLMTIHRAKGLEFPVVCVADLGKDGREDDSALRVTDDGRVGIRLASLEGGSVDGAQLGRIRAEQKAEDEEEERRIFYVAATRAQEHLIFSGATDLEKRPATEELAEPMRWIWPVLNPDLVTGEATVSYDGRTVGVRTEVLTPATVDRLLAAADREPAPPEPEPEPKGPEASSGRALEAVGLPDALAVSRLSYSGLEAYDSCGYRFYLEKVLKLPRPSDTSPIGEPLQALPATTRGSIVHALLEELDFAAPEAPRRSRVERLIAARSEPVRDAEVMDLAAMVEGFIATPMCGRIAAAEVVKCERPFVFTLDTHKHSLLVNGVVDVWAQEGDGLLVVDYKSNRLAGASPAEVTEADYSTQRLVYALAALRHGAGRVEVAYVFLERPGEVVSQIYEASQASALEAQLRELAAGVTAGSFEPSAQPGPDLCRDCPGRKKLCSWEADRTLGVAAPA